MAAIRKGGPGSLASNHPNIVTIYDIGSENGRDFIAMEYVDGESLRSVRSGRGLELKRALEMIAQAASALAAAHEGRMVPAEILAKAMAKDPANRYRHAGDFELGLRRG